MSADKARSKLVFYRPDLGVVFERLSTTIKKPLPAHFIARLPRSRSKKPDPNELTVRELPPSISKMYTAFKLTKKRLDKAIHASSEPISLCCSQDTSFDIDVKAALKTNCFERITANPSRAKLKTPTLKKLYKQRVKAKRKIIKIDQSFNSQFLPMMLYSSSLSGDSRPSTGQIPAYILSDESELAYDPKTTGRLSRVPSLRDYPVRRIKVDLSETDGPKFTVNKSDPCQVKLEQEACKVSLNMKGSRVKTAPHAVFRPVLSRELTPNHFKRARPVIN